MFLFNMSFISLVKWTIIIFHEWLLVKVDNNYISRVASPLMKYDYCPLHE